MRIAILAILAVALAGSGATAVYTLTAVDSDPGLPPLESAGPFLLAQIYAKETGSWEHAWSTL